MDKKIKWNRERGNLWVNEIKMSKMKQDTNPKEKEKIKRMKLRAC